MSKFNFSALLNQAQERDDFEEIWLSPFDVCASDRNFYKVEDIEALADSIRTVGQQQPTVVTKIDNKYHIVSGHRRNEANCLIYKQDGKHSDEKIKFLYKPMSREMFELSLIIGNAYNRELSPFEKMQQASRLKTALQEAKKSGVELHGKMRDIIAETLSTSSTQIARFEKIEKDLEPEPKKLFERGTLGVTHAYETSRLPREQQLEIAECIENGEEPQQFFEFQKKVSETDTFEEQSEPVVFNDILAEIHLHNSAVALLEDLKNQMGRKYAERLDYILESVEFRGKRKEAFELFKSIKEDKNR